jgi:pimeloyl-ACP methyl ester carboxylesterase
MSREALLLLPGLVCDRAVWDSQIGALSSRHECLVADYGAADSITAMAQAALSVAPEVFSVAGHSMGGRVALEIVRAAPQRVIRLALLDTGYQACAGGMVGAEETRQRQRLLDIATTEGMRAMGREWVRGMVHPERLQDAELIGRILDMIERKTPAIFAAQIRALLGRPSAEGLLGAIARPTLIACGREDAWSPLARHQEMAARIAGASLAVIERAGHMSTMEQPAAVSAALARWLEMRVSLQ